MQAAGGVTVRWQAQLDDQIAPQTPQSAHADDMPGEAITALLYVPQVDQLVVASGAGSVCALDPWTGQRLAKLTAGAYFFSLTK